MLLIIYAHPKTRGNGYSILQEVKKQLGRRKYEVLDLYAMRYDPVLKDEELYTAGKKKISKRNLEIQKKIRKAEGLVFVYPVWWGSMPAILKGFIDRVLTPPFAFEYVKKPIIGYIPQGNLNRKKAVIFCTTGSKKWQSWLILRNRFKSLVRNDMLGFCGIKTEVYQFAGAGKWDDKRRPEVEKMVRKGLKHLQ